MAHRLHYRPTSDLSLHHLPSPSRPDDSLSFEIPLAVSSADLLLADNSDDFLKGVDCTLTTPPPSRALDTPLTLSELSPTPRVATIPSFQIPSIPSSRLNTNLPDRPSPQKTPQLAGSTRLNTPKLVNTPVSAARLASLKAEIDSLGRDSGEETETEPSKPAIQRAPTAKLPATRLRHDTKLRKGDERKHQTKATVVDGRVAKRGIRNILPPSKFSRDISVASRQHKPASHKLIRPDSGFDKITTNRSTGEKQEANVVASDGAAERLVLLNQMLMKKVSSFENLEDLVDDANNITSHGPTSNPSPSNTCNDGPLTLSQISPCKEDNSNNPAASASQSPAPITRGGKRPVTAISDSSSSFPRKKSRTAVAALPPVRRSSKPGVLTLQLSTGNNKIASSSKLPSSPSGATRLGPHIRQSPALKTQDKRESSTSKAPSYCRYPDKSHKPNKISGDQKASKTVKVGTSIGQQPVSLPTAKPTKPAGFTFRSDIRLEARKAEFDAKTSMSDARQRTQSHHASIPDFKALHTAELQKSLEFRRERKAPTVPITPELNTVLRAKQRERFDEMMRQKEMDMDRVKEEQRKVREQEVELEVKQLRKKAVPKAHEVPEWYADAPKRSGSVHKLST